MHRTNNFVDFDIRVSGLKAKVKPVGGIGQTRDMTNPTTMITRFTKRSPPMTHCGLAHSLGGTGAL
jgi:hypothetical protein